MADGLEQWPFAPEASIGFVLGESFGLRLLNFFQADKFPINAFGLPENNVTQRASGNFELYQVENMHVISLPRHNA